MAGFGAMETEVIAADFSASVRCCFRPGLAGMPVPTAIGDCGSCTWYHLA
jgi:hypothetical protein